jgi:DNA helicase-2/ATP-dependent DNA helicase PcrA
MNNQESQKEYQRLAETLKQIETQLVISEEYCGTKQVELKNTLLSYWEDGGSNINDEAQIIESVNCQRAVSSIVHTTPLKLRAMLNSPYFGRIDFSESHNDNDLQAEQIYIGISTLTNKENGDFWVYDWRAPVSGMFYDFGLGDAWYNSPSGKIDGFIALKRQYKIVNGLMQYMFNADLKIDDDILQEILAKSADDKMHTIVNSIQREQNQIIRDDNHRVLLVEGPAGSGKTSVALHRIAFLLYHDRETITKRNILILSPNYLFSDYISNVLPEMGEENVMQLTFQDYTSRSIAQLPIQFENRTSHLENTLSNISNDEYAIRMSNIRFKSSRDFEQLLMEYLDWIQTSLVNNYPSIEFRNQLILSNEEWKEYYTNHFSAMPPSIRLQKIRRIIQLRMRPLVHAVREEKEAEIIERAEEVNDRVIKALARLAAKKEFDPLLKKLEQLTDLNFLFEYRKLFEDNWLFDHCSSKMVFPEQWHSLQNQTLSYIDAGTLPYEDIPPFLYFLGVLQGFPIRRNIKHLVIDEAQDYTVLQFKILAALFPNSTWTVVGDPAQSIHPFMNTADFKDISKIIGIENHLSFRLTRSYRSTKQIQAFCQSILPKVKVEPINRSGLLPLVTKVDNNQRLISAVLHAIHSILNEGWHSIGIISKSAGEASTLFDVLTPHTNLHLVVEEDDDFHRGVVVIPAYLAKGLEFDAVLVIHADAVNYTCKEDRHILYIICTRALHRLNLFYIDTPSPFLTEMDKNLYQVLAHNETPI